MSQSQCFCFIQLRFTFTYCPIFLKEKPSGKSLAALIISLAGVVIVIGPKNLVFSQAGLESGYLFGVLMGLFAGFFYACITMNSRYLKDEYSGLEQLFISTGVTLVFLLPFVTQASAASLVENLPVLLFLGVMITSSRLNSLLYRAHACQSPECKHNFPP